MDTGSLVLRYVGVIETRTGHACSGHPWWFPGTAQEQDLYLLLMTRDTVGLSGYPVKHHDERCCWARVTPMGQGVNRPHSHERERESFINL